MAKIFVPPILAPLLPQGRLTLTTVVPVLTAPVATSANVLYTPYVGNQIPIWDGVQWAIKPFSEMTNVLANSATGNAGPAAGAASKNYDIFAWNNAGVITLTRGGAWNSDTVRSATTENDLQRVSGLLCNLNTITNGPAAGFGTYLGTVRTDAGGATVSWSLGGSASGGTPATINVWNMYNRNTYTPSVQDSTASWNYTSATIRASNNSNGNRISFVRGLDNEGVKSDFKQRLSPLAAAAANSTIYVGLDSTSAVPAAGTHSYGFMQNTLVTSQESANALATYASLPGLGFHFIQALEQGDGTNANTFFGATGHQLSVQVAA